MKDFQIEKMNLLDLSIEEISIIEGGTFWGDVAYLAGAIVGGLITMGEGGKGNPHI